jgi:hypothetical protein
MKLILDTTNHDSADSEYEKLRQADTSSTRIESQTTTGYAGG